MPHLFTRAWAVAGGGSLAVLLLAYLSASLREQEPAEPEPDDCLLPVPIAIRRRIAAVVGIPLMIAGLVVLWRRFGVPARRHA